MKYFDLQHKIHLDTTKVIIAISSVVAMIILYQFIFYLLKRWASHKKRILPGLLNEHIYIPGLVFVINLALFIVLVLFRSYVNERFFLISRHCLQIIGISALGFLLIKTITVLSELTFHHFKDSDPLNYTFRKTKTKFYLIQRILTFIIVFATLAIILMTFENIRQIGGTLLASAGVVGLIIGFAAQKSLGTLFAGIQIAIAQPIRIDDVVVVEGEYGTIGEITLTYVVVNSWDGRRLVIPISYFLEKPFENWTRESPEVIAKVKIHVDYSTPVEEIRQRFKEWVESSPLWDKRSWNFIVSEATDKTILLRGTVSARNSGDAFDLECMMRERLISYIQQNHPQCLPSSRIRITD